MTNNKAHRRKSTKPIDVDRAKDIIESCEHIDDLTWDAIAAELGHNERSLRRIDAIYQAFWEQKDKLSRPERTGRRSPEKIESDTIKYLRTMMAARDETIRQKDVVINNFRRVFIQLIQIANRNGIDLERAWQDAVKKAMSN